MNFWMELIAFPTLFFGGIMMLYSLLVKNETIRDKTIVFVIFLPSVVLSLLTIIYR